MHKSKLQKARMQQQDGRKRRKGKNLVKYQAMLEAARIILRYTAKFCSGCNVYKKIYSYITRIIRETSKVKPAILDHSLEKSCICFYVTLIFIIWGPLTQSLFLLFPTTLACHFCSFLIFRVWAGQCLIWRHFSILK